MLQNLSNHLWVLDAGDDRERSAALLAPVDRDPHASTPSAQQIVKIRHRMHAKAHFLLKDLGGTPSWFSGKKTPIAAKFT